LTHPIRLARKNFLQNVGYFAGEDITNGLGVRKENFERSLNDIAISICTWLFPGEITYNSFVINNISIKATDQTQGFGGNITTVQTFQIVLL
jgi:hypothetical protein